MIAATLRPTGCLDWVYSPPPGTETGPPKKTLPRRARRITEGPGEERNGASREARFHLAAPVKRRWDVRKNYPEFVQPGYRASPSGALPRGSYVVLRGKPLLARGRTATSDLTDRAATTPRGHA